MARSVVLVVAAFGLVSAAAGDARAQSAPADAADATGAPSSQAILFEPLRLALLSEVPPTGRGLPGCADHLEAAGTATAATFGAPMQSVFAHTLLPRLTLFGFSRAGCPADAVIGGGLVYVVPLRPKVFFVTGLGTVLQPRIDGQPPVVHAVGRADVVFDRGAGRSLHVGVRAGGRAPGLTFGGIF